MVPTRAHTPKVHLVVLYTEGAPHDSGIDLTESARPLIDKAKKHFDSVRVHTPRSLIADNPTWAEHFSDLTDTITSHPQYSEDLKWNRNWAKIGLFAWKPRLIAKELISQTTAPGDIVFYRDSDTIKYPEYLTGISRWARWLKKTMKNLDVLGFDDNGASITSDIKPELIERYVNQEDPSLLSHLWAGAFAVKKTPGGLEFARAWSALSTFDNLSPLTRSPRPEGFVWNVNEQAVLTALWHSDSVISPEVDKDVTFLHRSRSIPPPSPVAIMLRNITRRLSKKLNRMVRRP